MAFDANAATAARWALIEASPAPTGPIVLAVPAKRVRAGSLTLKMEVAS
jgi:hypothetical protein